MRIFSILSGVSALMISAGGLSAQQRIMDVPELVDPLVEARAADVIRKACPDYSVNMIAAMSEARALKKKAIAMGYPEDTVMAFIKDDANKKEIYNRASATVSDLGGTKGDKDSMCKAGDALVAKGGVASRLISR